MLIINNKERGEYMNLKLPDAGIVSSNLNIVFIATLFSSLLLFSVSYPLAFFAGLGSTFLYTLYNIGQGSSKGRKAFVGAAKATAVMGILLVSAFAIATLVVPVFGDGRTNIWTTDELGVEQSDFAPGDMVYIHGEGFEPYTQITQIDITRPDPDFTVESCPLAGRCDAILPITDDAGAFSYYVYDLNGIEGTYIIDASDGTNSAQIMFTDGTNFRGIGISTPTEGDLFTGYDSVVVSGTAIVQGGDEAYGHYGVKVTWGDTPDLTTPCLPMASDWTWTTDPSNNHQYLSGGQKTITAKLYHLCEPGSEPNQAEATVSLNINICIDNDQDGYGQEGSTGCTNPETDCDDDNANVNPGAKEICDNGIDDDCDELTDCADSDCESDPACVDCDYYDNQGDCDADHDCYWCPECDPSHPKQVNTWHQGICVGTETPCGWHCEMGYCGAQCDTNPWPCPTDYCDGLTWINYNDYGTCSLSCSSSCTYTGCGPTEVNCDDGDVCTEDTCDPVGGCQHTPIQGCCNYDYECDDQDACTTDICEANVCVNIPIDCDDGNDCTQDSCDSATGCVNDCQEGTPCNDNNPDTDNDQCKLDGGNCVCEGEYPCGYWDIPELCSIAGCDWCYVCSGHQRNFWGHGTCVDAGTDCGYYCNQGDCGATCDSNDDCQPDCDGDIYYWNGVCEADCTCSYTTQDCNVYDGWYCNGNTREYRDWGCELPNGCVYTVTDTVSCDDKNECTTDSCVGPDKSATCQNTPKPQSTPCEADGDFCTTDHCDGEGACVFLEYNKDPDCELYDLGDAPDSTNTFSNQMTAYGLPANYPTVHVAGSPPYGPCHNNFFAVLGTQITFEYEADSGADQDGVNNIIPPSDISDQDSISTAFGMDDSLKHVPIDLVNNDLLLPHCQMTSIPVEVTITQPPEWTYYMNIWIDYNGDGDWGIPPAADTVTCSSPGDTSEWVVQNFPVFGFGTFVVTPQFMGYNPNPGQDAWMRVQLTEVLVMYEDGSGPQTCYEDGETEDYDVRIVECLTDVDCDSFDDDYCDDNKRMHVEGVCSQGVCAAGTPVEVGDCDGYSDECHIGVCIENGGTHCEAQFHDDEGPNTYDGVVSPYYNNGIFNATATTEDECSVIKTANYYIGHSSIGSCSPYLAEQMGTIYPVDDSFDLDNLVEDLHGTFAYYRDGLNYICIEAQDNADHWGNCECAYFETDTIPPDCPYDIYLDDELYPDEYLICGDDAWLNATVCDQESYIQGGEYFINLPPETVPAPWSGYWMNPLYNFTRADGHHCAVIGALVVNNDSLEEGTHYIKLRGKDTAENWGKITQCQPTISFIRDTTAPQTTKTVGDNKVACNYLDDGEGNNIEECWYITQNTLITLEAYDWNPDSDPPGYNDLPGEYSDYVEIYYRQRWKENFEDAWGAWSGWTLYTGPFTKGEDSIHELEYYAVDLCGEEEEHHFEIDIVDTVPPETTKKIIGPQYYDEIKDKFYIDGVTEIELTCVDPQPHPVDDVEIYYKYFVDDVLVQDWTLYTGEFSFPEESKHDLEYYCIDALGNEETHKFETDYVDHTKPVTTKTYGTPHYPQGINEGALYPHWITTSTPITLTADDGDEIHDSGVAVTKWRNTLVPDIFCEFEYECEQAVGIGDWNTYIGPFTKETESCHLIEYYSVDNVEKTEIVKKQCVYVEDTPPTIYKDISGPMHECTPEEAAMYGNPDYGCHYITQQTTIYLNCVDEGDHPVDDVTLYYRDYLIGDTVPDYTAVPGGYETIKKTEDSEHILEFYCVDALGNSQGTSENPHVEIDIVDTKKPVSEKILGEPKHECTPEEQAMYYPCMPEPTDGCFFITQNTLITLTCEDPQPHPVDHVKLYYRDYLVGEDEPDFTMVSGDYVEIYKEEDSAHILEWYCVDELGNTEATHVEYDIVDTVPPVGTKIVGEPKIIIYEDEILSAADRIIDLQYTDGSWDWVVTYKTGPTGTTYRNIAGVTAEVLLDAYKLTGDTKYLDAAEDAGDYLLSFSISKNNRYNAFNMVFLYHLADLTGKIKYNNHADNLLNHVLYEENYWTNHNGNHCGMDGCTASELLNALKDFRGWAGDPSGIVVWDLFHFVEAAQRAGETSFSTDMANELDSYMSQSGYISTIQYYDLGLSAGVVALGNAGIDYSDHMAKLLVEQNPDGSFDNLGSEPIQTTAYALIALEYADEHDEGTAASEYLVNQFRYSNGDTYDGWLDDGDEYSEVTSEAAQALYDFSWRGGIWVRDHVTEITLDCTDPEPHPVDHEIMCYKISFDDPQTPWLTEQYCYEFGGEMIEDECCVDVSGEQTYTFVFTEDSLHDLEYYCVDELGNENEVDIEWFRVDSVPPETTKTYGLPFYTDGTSKWIDTTTSVTLTAEDGGEICAVGVDEIYWRNIVLDNPDDWHYCYVDCETWMDKPTAPEPYNPYVEPFYKEGESCHIIEYYSVDELGNEETMKWQCVFVEDKPPVTTKSFEGPTYPEDLDGNGQIEGLVEENYWLQDHVTKVKLTAVDQDPHPSGVDYIHVELWKASNGYDIDTRVWSEDIGGNYFEFTIDEDCLHEIRWYAVDNLGHIEDTHIQQHRVDSQPPETVKTFDGPVYHASELDIEKFGLTTENEIDNFWLRDHYTWVILDSVDTIVPCDVGVDTLYVELYKSEDDGDTYSLVWAKDVEDQSIDDTNTNIGEVQYKFQIEEDCVHKIVWYAVDELGNTEVTHVQYHRVDSTPPESVKTFEGPTWAEGDKSNYWVTSDTEITLTAIDEAEPCAVGVAGFHVELWWDSDCDGDVDTLLNPGNQEISAPYEYTFTFGDFNHPGADYRAPYECLHEIRWYAEDLLGNKEDENIQHHKVDDTPPHILILKPVDGWYSDGEDIAVVAVVEDLTNPHGQCNPLYGEQCAVGIEDGTPCEGYFIDLLPWTGNIDDIIIPLESHMTYNAEAHECQGYVTIPEDSGIPDGVVIFAMTAKDNLGNEGNSIMEIVHTVLMSCGEDDYECIMDVVQDIVTIWNLPKIGIDNHAPEVTITTPLEDTLFGGETVDFSADVIDANDGDVTSTITSGTPCYVSVGGVSLGTVPYNNIERKCSGTIMIPDTENFLQGTQDFMVNITDNAGNTGYDAVSIIVDTVKPVLSITNPEPNTFVKDTVEIEVYVDDENVDETYLENNLEISVDHGNNWFSPDECHETTSYTCTYEWDTTQEEEGTVNGIKARVADKAGNGGESEVVVVIVDNVGAEIVAIVQPYQNEIVSGETTLEAVASDQVSGIDKVDFYINGDKVGTDYDPTGNWKVTWDSEDVGDGVHTVKAKATDNIGHERWSQEVSFIVDNDPPTDPPYVNVEDPDGDGYDTDGTVTWTWGESTDDGSGVEYYEIEIPGNVETKVFGTVFTVSDMIDGTYTAGVRAVDKTGKTSGWIYSDPITVDTQPPSGLGILINNGDGWTNSQDVTLSLTYLGDADECQYSNDGTGWSEFESASLTKAWALTEGDGLKTVHYRCKDEAGNLAEGVTDTILLDMTGPHTWVTSPEEGTWLNGLVQITADATDFDGIGVDYVEFFVDDLSIGSDYSNADGKWDINWDTSGDSDGAHELTAKGYDLLGNDPMSSKVLVFTDNTAPSAPVLGDPGNYDIDGTVTWEWNKPSYDTENYVIEIDDDAGFGSPLVSVPTIAPEYTRSGLDEGTWYARVMAFDDLDNPSGWSNVVDITVDWTPPSGLSILIDGGSEWTNSQNVILDLIYPGDAYKCQYSNDGGEWSAEESPSSTKAWILTESDGTKTVYYRCRDEAGNMAEPVTDTIKLDTAGPNVHVTSPEEGDWLSGVVQIIAEADDGQGAGVDYVEFFVDGSSIGTDNDDTDGKWNVDWDTSGYGDDEYDITAKGYDLLGNDPMSDKVTVSTDNTAPNCPYDLYHSYAQEYDTDGIVTWGWGSSSDNGIGIDYYELQLCHEAYGCGPSIVVGPSGEDVVSYTVSDLMDGGYTAHLSVVDKLGNGQDCEISDSVIVDTTKPSEVEIWVEDYESEGSYYDTDGNYEVDWNGGEDENFDYYELFRNGESIWSGSGMSYEESPEDGTYTYYVAAYDEAGWETVSDEVTVIVDTVAPEIVPESVDDTVGMWAFSFTINDGEESSGLNKPTHDGGLFTICTYNEDYTSGTCITPITTEEVTLSVEDKAGWDDSYTFLRGVDPLVIVSGPEESKFSDTSVWISWETNKYADSWVKYGERTEYCEGEPEGCYNYDTEQCSAIDGCNWYEEYDEYCDGTPTLSCYELGEQFGEEKCWETPQCYWDNYHNEYCDGTPDENACENYDSEQCDYIGGCDWIIEEPYCDGTPDTGVCENYSPCQCDTISGCGWVESTNEYCDGTPLSGSCSLYSPEQCQAIEALAGGCEWIPIVYDVCEGTPETDACDPYNYDQCNWVPGCTWMGYPEDGYCYGTPTVSCEEIGHLGDYYGVDKCSETLGCGWEHYDESYCDGTPESCDFIGDNFGEYKCDEETPGCDWIVEDTSHCEGTPDSCGIITDDFKCDEETPGCYWVDSTEYCQGTPDSCGIITDDFKCDEETPGCYWVVEDYDYCNGDVEEDACEEYDEGQCLAINGCEWNRELIDEYCEGVPELTCYELGEQFGDYKCYETPGCEWIVECSYVQDQHTWDPETEHNILLTGLNPDTDYCYKVRSEDSNGLVVEDEGSFTTLGAPDTEAPVILSTSPSGIVEDNEVVLEVTTNEDATCYYGEVDDVSTMTQMATTGGTSHSEDLGTLEDGLKVYHIQCEDVAGNWMEHSKTIVFSVHTEGEWCYAEDLDVVGWNTFLLPKLILDDINFNSGQEPYLVEDVLASLYSEPKYSIVWYYDGENWLFFDPENPEFSTLTQFNDEVGNPYFIKMKQPDRLELPCPEEESECVSFRTYTVDADFDEGALIGLEHETVHDQLQLTPGEVTTYPVMWIANAGEDSVSKWNTETNKELARYHTWFGALGNHGAWSGPAPSRTAVDVDGNCYVANRHFDGPPADVIKILQDDWIDRNGNAVMDTSYDANDDGAIDASEMLPMYDNNSNGVIDDDEITDERIAWAVTVGDPDGLGRSLAIDLDGNIWVGLYNDREYWKISGENGSVLAGPIDVSPHTPYGALVDKNGILWGASLSSNLLKLDTNTHAVTTYSVPDTYGIALGTVEGNTHVYLGGVSQTYTDFNSSSETYTQPAGSYYSTLGIATDSEGNIVAGAAYSGGVSKFTPNGSLIWTAAAQGGITSARGTVVDSDDNIWVVHVDHDKTSKFNGTDGSPLGVFNTGDAPYTYSDATGLGLRSSVVVGTWDVIFDTEVNDTSFDTVSWNSYEPQDTSLEVKARSSNNQASWSSWETATNGVDLTSTPAGRYLQILTTMQITAGNESPVLYDLSVAGTCAGEPE